MPDGSGLPEKSVKTACPYCGVGCGVRMAMQSDMSWKANGDENHPSNFGRLCSKGSALGETLDLKGRLLDPVLDGKNVEWPVALDAAADRLSAIRKEHGPDAIAVYLSGQLLTEDYYVANKFMKGFVGSANVDTNSRLCMSSSVAGHKKAFGADTVPGAYEDLDRADLVILTGSNAAWCHPVLFQRIQKARAERGMRLVVIDPRETETSKEADLHLPIAPGKDTLLFSALLKALSQSGALDQQYVETHTLGYATALARAVELAPSMDRVCEETRLRLPDVKTFIRWFIETEKVVTCYSQGVNQSAQGTDKVNAILNCHLATNRIGREGMGPFSLTGQPNAMGGREVGGLANQLAAHMEFQPESVDRVRRFWNAPHIATTPGLKAIDLFDAIDRGEIKALWVMGTNPAVSLPDADRVRRAMKKLELLIVSENMASTDSMDNAHIRLPAAAWGEKAGTVTNSERRISRQRSFLSLPGRVKPDWWAVSQVAQRMGYAEAFSYASPAEIFREHAELSGFENAGSRDFDISAYASCSDQAYEALDPFQWPAPGGLIRTHGECSTQTHRFFAEGKFYTPSGKANFIAPARPELSVDLSVTYPLLLNTGRIRDQWHTMTRSGKSPRLGRHKEEPFLDINTADARKFHLTQGELATVESPHGQAVLRVNLTDAQTPGDVFAPIHWTGQNASAGRIGALLASHVDPFSGQPEAKAAPVSVKPFQAAFYGFVMSTASLDMTNCAYWAKVQLQDTIGYRFALTSYNGKGANKWMSDLLGVSGTELIQSTDKSNGVFRAAHLIDDRLQAVAYLSPQNDLPSWSWLETLFAKDKLEVLDRRYILAGRSIDGAQDPGPTVCACYGVGRNTLIDAICKKGLITTQALGEQLKAGTNCGSCLPELRSLIGGHDKTAKAKAS
ncbi:MAG: molybdopterin-dependent oxidoreductase [Parvibaculaceae bacterium]|nr:molybdopterin-dependent oxidoreductase [Parvibaculaceae bacterium]